MTNGASRRGFLAGSAAAAATAAFPAIARAQAQTVRIGVLRILSDAPFLVADKKGFWKDEGVSVEFAPFHSSGDMVVPMSQDALDAGGGTTAASLYNGVARGLASRVVASKGTDARGYGSNKILVRTELIKSGRYTSPKDLKGMSFAGNEPGAGSSAAIFFLLQKFGLGWSDLQRENLAFPEHVAALQNGKIDASFTAEPFATIATADGTATAVMSNDQWYPDQQLSIVLCGGDFLKKRPELARRFMRGYIRATRFYSAALNNGRFAGPNADEVIAILNETTKPKDPNLYRRTTAFYVGPNGRLETASMKRDLDYFRSQGLIASPTIGVGDVVDESWLTQALKDVGPYRPRNHDDERR